MKLSKIQVDNYRQLNKVLLFFQEDITVLAGPNNSGKTTFNSLVKGVLGENKLLLYRTKHLGVVNQYLILYRRL